jgi:hypothetical protein
MLSAPPLWYDREPSGLPNCPMELNLAAPNLPCDFHHASAGMDELTGGLAGSGIS